MKQKATTTKNTKKQTLSTSVKGEAVYSTLRDDVKNSLLVLSLIVNLYIFTLWLVLQVTTQYDAQIANFLFTR
jgi:hypothetical protein